MTRTCTVCAHPQLAAINKALVAGTALRNIAEQYARSSTALFRHRNEHIPAALSQAREAEAVAQADDLLGQLRDLQATTLAILTTAKDADEPLTALKAIGEVRRNVELLAKLLGQLDTRPVVNLTIAPEWLALRGRLVTALAPYPEARVAVAAVISEVA